MPSTWDAGSITVLDSWYDSELVLATETDPECKAEYIAELARRAVARAQRQEQANKIQADLVTKIKELLNG